MKTRDSEAQKPSLSSSILSIRGSNATFGKRDDGRGRGFVSWGRPDPGALGAPRIYFHLRRRAQARPSLTRAGRCSPHPSHVHQPQAHVQTRPASAPALGSSDFPKSEIDLHWKSRSVEKHGFSIIIKQEFLKSPIWWYGRIRHLL